MEHMTIKEAISIYLEDVEFRQRKSQDTVKTYRNTLRRFEHMMGESNVTLLKDVDETAHAYAYRDELVDCE